VIIVLISMDELRESTGFLIPAALAAVFLVLFIAGRLRPLRRRKRGLYGRLKVNAVLTSLALLTAAVVVRPVVAALAARGGRAQFGFFGLTAMPAAAQFAAGFVLMDFTFYWWHRATHEVPLLWRLHNVHHFDPDLDVTTSFRFHAGEILLSTAFRALQVWALGITRPVLIAYEAVFFAGTMFHHSNIRLPFAFERVLNYCFVTPRMHGIHHSVVKSETDSNYGSVFRWWDMLGRTLVLNVPQREIRIGVPGYMLPEQNRIVAAMTAPFETQKEYWAWPNGRRPERIRNLEKRPANSLTP